ncbi:MAG: hypothetical protein ACK4IK_10490 [Bacteroidia bacterium]
MKKYFVIIILTFISLKTIAQGIEEDIIILTNGSLYRGKIIDSTQIDRIKIECYDRNIYVFNRTEISEIKKGPADLKYSISKIRLIKENNKVISAYFKKGFKFSVETLYGYNFSKTNSNNFNYAAFLISSGYRINNGMYIGIQSGINYLGLFKKSNSYQVEGIPNLYFYLYDFNRNLFPARISIPILFNVQQTLLLDKMSSVFSLSFGYDYNITSNQTKIYTDTRYLATTETKQIFKWSNSLILNPEIKNIIAISDKINFLASIGFLQNNIDFDIEHTITINYYTTSNSSSNNIRDTFRYRFLYLKLGIGF